MSSPVTPTRRWLSGGTRGWAMVCAVLIVLRAAGAEPVSWSVKSWRTADGLPQNTVQAIARTPDGYLWLGTQGGLARFDGVRFVTYGLADGLKGVNISCLLEDGQGGLWVGTYGGGLSHLRDGVFTSLTTAEGLAHESVFSLARAGDKGVWVGCKGGLQRWDGKNLVTFGEGDGLLGKEIASLAVDAAGVLWVSTAEAGLFRLQEDRFEAVPGPDGTALGQPYLMGSRDGALWASIGNGKVLRRREGAWTEFNSSHGVPFSVIYFLAEGPEGEIWAGSAEQGLHVFHDGKFQPATAKTGGPDPSIRALMVGRDGVVWAGSQAGGLSRLTRPGVSDHPVGEPGRSGTVNGVVEEPAGHFWVATYGGGLFQGPLDRLEPVTGPKELAGNPHLTSGLRLQSGGALFFGHRILLEKPAGSMDLRHVEGPETWSSACEDGAGCVWLGTYDGQLWQWADGALRKAEGETFSSSIAALAGDSGPAVWIATSRAGLYHREAGKTRHWDVKDGLPAVSLKSLHRDAEGTVWIGTAGGGLAWLRDGVIRSVDARHGLGDNFIVQILEHDGHLWLGCFRGIFRVSKRELEDVVAGRAATVHPLAIDESDGMTVAECSGYHSPAGLTASDGSLLFSTARSVVAVDPERFGTVGPPPPARIEEVLVDGQSVTPGRAALSIPPGLHEVEIRYTAFNDAKPEQIRFRHRLGGREVPWKEAGNSRSARFSLLPPGDYRFEVSAANQDGRWLEEAATVAFTVQPHFWQTLGFRIAAGLALLASGGGLAAWMARHRIRRAREREQLARAEAEVQQHLNEVAHLTRVATLGELSAALAHELNQPLTAILCNAELARTQLAADPAAPAELKEMIQDIIDDDQRASEVIRRLRILLKKGDFQPEELDVNEVIGEVLHLMKGDLTARGVGTVAELGSSLPPVRADRVQLQQVLINLVLNASDAMAGNRSAAATLTIRSQPETGGMVRIAVADTGPGIPPGAEETIFNAYETSKKEGLGLGLSLSRSILFAHGGRLWAENRPGGGAVLYFTLPEWKTTAP